MVNLTKKKAYEILHLPYGASLDAVRSAYMHLASKWHPDKNGQSTKAQEQFHNVSTAYKRLKERPDIDNEVSISMSLAEMLHVFHELSSVRRAMNGISSDSDISDDDDDDDDDDFIQHCIDRFNDKLTRRKENAEKGVWVTVNPRSEDQAKKNASELLDQEEKEKRKAAKRRAKKKRRKEKKKLEKENNMCGQQNGVENRARLVSTDSSGDEESLDINSAFVATAANKKITSITQYSTKKGKDGKFGDTNDDGDNFDPVVLQSRQLAIRGNEMANLGHYSAAVDLFSEAIKLDPKDFRFFGNRSYCYDRLGQFEKALKDADKAISLQCCWPKGYFRKGRALSGLKLYAEAECAFEQVLKLDKLCEDAMQELLKVRTYQITDMGFSKNQAEAAIKQHVSVQAALDSLLAGVFAEAAVKPSSNEAHAFREQPSLVSAAVADSAAHAPGGPDRLKMNPKNPEGLTSLWVGNVLPEVTEKQLVSLFSKYGTLTGIRMIPEKFCAFVNYKTQASAGKAMSHLQGTECAGQRLLIKFPDNPLVNGQQVTVIKKTKPAKESKQQQQQVHKGNKQQQQQQNLALQKHLQQQQQLQLQQQQQQQAAKNASKEKLSGPVNGNECYFWRTTGCVYGNNCRYDHLPAHKGVDKKPWQKT